MKTKIYEILFVLLLSFIVPLAVFCFYHSSYAYPNPNPSSAIKPTTDTLVEYEGTGLSRLYDSEFKVSCYFSSIAISCVRVDK